MDRIIRKATTTDLPELVLLFEAYRTFYQQKSNLKEAIIFLTERIENQESVIFMAFDEKNIAVGFTQLYPLFSSTQMKKSWLLNDLFVDSKYRGKGFSVALIEKAKELCRTTKAYGMMLETDKKNDIGNKLYPKAGFMLDENHNFYSWET